jgi:hypothetical protein
VDKIHTAGIATDDHIHAILNTLMATAIYILKTSQVLSGYNTIKSGNYTKSET